MPKASDILWFKQQFQAIITETLAGTPFDVDMLVAIACQETGHIWSVLRHKDITVADILALCVGDTLDEDKGRRAFPRTKAALLAKPRGNDMFEIARNGLVAMAKHIAGFSGAAAKPNKFCHGFGLFQYDLQFFIEDPDYFLERRYEKFDQTLGKCLAELKNAAKRIGFDSKTELTDFEFACIAIAYNTGGFKPSKGLKQGHFNGAKFYGEEIFDFLRLSRTVALDNTAPVLVEAAPGRAIIAEPTPIAATGAVFEVDTLVSPLRLRSQPEITKPTTANVIGHLPDGHKVGLISGKKVNGFLEVETSLNGAHFRGFAFAKFLKPAAAASEIVVAKPRSAPPVDGLVAVLMPRKPNTLTKRTEPATAHSLNEANQPGRTGTTPDALRAELAKIIGWLAVDKASHKRYQPHDGLTFCNIYVHDYCHLAGIYLPRVWWTQKAVEALVRGETAEPKIGSTIDEQRANDLFRWLSDFGLRFGWRQTATLSQLQLEVNQGAVGLIVARRKEDGRSGHIVMVVPETDTERAKRNATGEVIAPLQSQAGATNFQYGRGSLDWWKHERFAESAFWLHA